MRILLAEDDPNISVITRLCLEKIGQHDVVLCADGEAAFQAASNDSFDLILLDGMMPKRSGLQVAMDLHQAGRTETPIIFLSAKTDEKEIRQFLNYGAGYIAKPFDPQKICSRIDAILTSGEKPTS